MMLNLMIDDTHHVIWEEPKIILRDTAVYLFVLVLFFRALAFSCYITQSDN